MEVDQLLNVQFSLQHSEVGDVSGLAIVYGTVLGLGAHEVEDAAEDEVNMQGAETAAVCRL
jgi:hypothetical protein